MDGWTEEAVGRVGWQGAVGREIGAGGIGARAGGVFFYGVIACACVVRGWGREV